MSTTKKLNQGLVTLTKENINEGRLGDKIKSISGGDKVLTEKELLVDYVPVCLEYLQSVLVEFFLLLHLV